jgi:hypothetical protein
MSKSGKAVSGTAGDKLEFANELITLAKAIKTSQEAEVTKLDTFILETREAFIKLELEYKKLVQLGLLSYNAQCVLAEPTAPKLTTDKFPHATSREFFITKFTDLKEMFVTDRIEKLVNETDDPMEISKTNATACYNAMDKAEKAKLKAHWEKCREDFNAKKLQDTNDKAAAGGSGS